MKPTFSSLKFYQIFLKLLNMKLKSVIWQENLLIMNVKTIPKRGHLYE